MKPAQITIAERVVAVLGCAAMSIAVASFDWRAGLFVLGALAVASVVDLRRRP